MKNDNYKILALKYRPKNFNELIGQDIMVQTITNSIQLNKLPNAYLLTGIRGVGKTTTARLIAKAINCNKNFINNEQCEKKEHCHCREISETKHLDVLEMDAASRTGIDDVRELIESSKYNPTNAKYKIFIIDEVHMLSKQAFNGLLKTLEEPPPHLKFIFATTEVKKIPVTIVSRCQRFDLNRVPIEILLKNLEKIAKLENGKISPRALKLIAQASEGSVRDSLSLLDRALISKSNKLEEVDEKFVRQMLGIVDRSQMVELLKFIFNGKQEQSIILLREMYNQGVEPTSFLNDILEIIYFIIQRKNLGNFESDFSISEKELKDIDVISKDINVSTLIVFWQFVIKTIDELMIVTNPILSTEMLIIKLIHLKDLPSYEGILNSLEKDFSNTKVTNIGQDINPTRQKEFQNESKLPKNQIKNTIQTKTDLSSPNPKKIIKDTNLLKIESFENLIEISSMKKEIELKYDLANVVNLVSFSEGKIDISFNENLRKDFVRNLSEKLLEWTGRRWVISLTKDQGRKTFSETKTIKQKENLEKEKKEQVYKKFKDIFSDAELIEVSEKD